MSIINEIINNTLSMVSYDRLVNLHNHCLQFRNTDFSFVECGVAKGGCLAIMKSISKNNKVFGFDSFEGMPMITEKDIGEYNKNDKRFVFINLSRCGNDVETMGLIMHEMMHHSFFIHNYNVDKEEEIITWAENESYELFNLIKKQNEHEN